MMVIPMRPLRESFQEELKFSSPLIILPWMKKQLLIQKELVTDSPLFHSRNGASCLLQNFLADKVFSNQLWIVKPSQRSWSSVSSGTSSTLRSSLLSAKLLLSGSMTSRSCKDPNSACQLWVLHCYPLETSQHFPNSLGRYGLYLGRF